jgi:hypothetical protein
MCTGKQLPKGKINIGFYPRGSRITDIGSEKVKRIGVRIGQVDLADPVAIIEIEGIDIEG